MCVGILICRYFWWLLF